MQISQDHSALDAFAIAGRLRFHVGPGGLPCAEIDNLGGSASVCLQGAHLTRFTPAGAARPLVWLSEAAHHAPGRSIRGGVPVCWPWFGAHAQQRDWPLHGFARTVPWQVVGSADTGGVTTLRLRLPRTAIPAAMWPHDTPVELRIAVSDVLEMELTTRNAGPDDVTLTEALHTYFEVGDIARAEVDGLDACDYLDKTRDFARFTQQGAVRFAGETDRVYLDTTAACVITDPVLGRRIRIDKHGSASTVVWTPWSDRAAAMGDFTADGWRWMLCVESANAADNRLLLQPGASHALRVRYAVEPL